MITTTPALDPALVNIILAGLLEREKPLDALAADVGMELDDLLELLDHPDMQAKIQRLKRALDQRAALLASAAESTAIGSLTALIEQVRTDQARRQEILAAREDAQNHTPEADRTKAVAECDAQLDEIDRHFRKFVEASRSARSVLNFIRTRKAPPIPRTPATDAEPAPSPAR